MPSPFKLPEIRPWQLRLFVRYTAFYLHRHFHAFYLLNRSSLSTLEGWPVLVCLNHPSWWDPLLALYLSQRFFPQRSHYAPIASIGLAKYRFFERLGFFGIDPQSITGANRFLQIGWAISERSDCALWVTVQGHFTDVRIRPVQIQAGVGHLAHRCDRLAVLPLALEYTFWEERAPEAFACFGEPIFISNGREKTPAEWTETFAAALEKAEDLLAGCVKARKVEAFQPLLSGISGTGGIYDLWRALKAFAGRKHGEHSA
jgi:1-acyl-sn-glycerol-3-phosphate acyltransferase